MRLHIGSENAVFTMQRLSTKYARFPKFRVLGRVPEDAKMVNLNLKIGLISPSRSTQFLRDCDLVTQNFTKTPVSSRRSSRRRPGESNFMIAGNPTKRLTAACALSLFVSASSICAAQSQAGTGRIMFLPAQTFRGWGMSLAWEAND